MLFQNGNSPLLIATMFGNFDFVQELLSHDADVNIQNKVNSCSILQVH